MENYDVHMQKGNPIYGLLVSTERQPIWLFRYSNKGRLGKDYVSCTSLTVKPCVLNRLVGYSEETHLGHPVPQTWAQPHPLRSPHFVLTGKWHLKGRLGAWGAPCCGCAHRWEAFSEDRRTFEFKDKAPKEFLLILGPLSLCLTTYITPVSSSFRMENFGF